MTAIRTEILAEGITLYPGDCLDVLAGLPSNSVDSCVTDPPYGLGFMGKHWDHGVPGIPYWKAVFRVLKPGAHLLSFGGTRTYHRMACAIEDAGFEIRDSIQWLYGSGFPKSHDVSKGIDRARNSGRDDIVRVCNWIADQCKARGVSRGDLDAAAGTSDMGGWWASRLEHRCNIPTLEQWRKIEPLVGLVPDWMVPLLLPAREPGEAWDQREVVGRAKGAASSDTNALGVFRPEYDATMPATDAARQWEGWGTALKPACEPIVLARKPLSESTVAANVLKWGTGALNIDDCRVEHVTVNGGNLADNSHLRNSINGGNGGNIFPTEEDRRVVTPNQSGRWPANVIHDGSDEVVGAFPDNLTSGTGSVKRATSDGHQGTVYGKENRPVGTPNIEYGDSGSAARFFYTAKADSDDRLGSKHPTVKPVDLIQYLVRLVTPPCGLVLDCFAGTGTTGEACIREKLRCILIEREAEYCDDIRRRMKLAMAGPLERTLEAHKARNKDKPVDHGPLFGTPA